MSAIESSESCKGTDLDSLSKQFVGGTIWMSASQIAVYVLSFGADILLARLLVPEDFGVFGLGVSFLVVVHHVSSWMFSTAIVETEDLTREFFDTAYTLSLGTGSLIATLAGLAHLLLRDFYSTQVLQVLVLLSVVRIPNLLAYCYEATLRRNMDYRSISMVHLMARVISALVAVILAWAGMGVWSLVGKEMVLVFSRFLGMRFSSRWKYRGKIEISTARRLIGYATRMLVASGFESLLANLQSMIVGTFLGAASLGHLNRAITFSQAGSGIMGGAVNHVALSAYSRLQGHRLNRAFELVNRILLRGTVLFAMQLLLVGQDMTLLLYGQQWSTAGRIVPLLAAYVISEKIAGNLKAFFYSQGSVQEVIIVRVLQNVAMIGGMFLVLRWDGLIGSALVLDVVYLMGVVLGLIYAQRYLALEMRSLIFPPIASGALTVVLFYIFPLARAHESATGVISITARVLGACLVYLGILCVLDGKRMQKDIGHVLGALGLKGWLA